ncbi:Nif3-like dinuclear metal center hexameric protein, partial [Spirillospora sp. NPDC049652]
RKALDSVARKAVPSYGVTSVGGDFLRYRDDVVAEFTARAAAGLPATVWGVRAAGDPDRPVRTVAVCGGAGDSLLDDVRAAGVDVYLTADLRHHPASEFVEAGGPALLDAAHWATEHPWLADAAAALTGALDLTTRVSTAVTDAWRLHGASNEGVK